jgi:hypothetical protein
MKRSAHPDVGTFLRIRLPDGSYGYGRALQDPYIAFHNFRTLEEVNDLAAISTKPILFTQAVRIRESDRWSALGKLELLDELLRPVVRFTQDVADFTRCTIYDSMGLERAATPEECIGLERAAIWEIHHIEERLLDTFLGRPNAVYEHLHVRLS